VTLPIYVYRCDCGLRFERLLPRDSEAPACPECGGATRKIPAGPSLGGRAGERPAQGSVPPPVRGLQAGGPERMKREVEFRQRLEAKRAENAAGSEAGTPPASAGT
jgi:putative FmdB family regulatory protein